MRARKTRTRPNIRIRISFLVQKKDHRRDSEPPIVVTLTRDAAVGGGLINGEAEGGVCGSVSREEQDEIYD
jgi:hypothetical protein